MMVASVARFPKKATYCKVQLLRRFTKSRDDERHPYFILWY